MVLDKPAKDVKRSAVLLQELADLFYKEFNERLIISCGSCVTTAMNKLKNKINMESNKKQKKEIKKDANFVLKVAYIREHSSRNVYTNETLTDKIAIEYIKNNINRVSQFSKVPDNLEELLKGKQVIAKKKFSKKEVIKEVTENKESK